jgi:ADP-ribosyl-[dinitrogen reductase] hydrolase
MYGAVIGDIVGSIYEFNNLKTKEFELFGDDSHFTDDTLCTVAVAYALLQVVDPTTALRNWSCAYPDLGYGSMFLRWLKQPDMGPYNSFGNGAAMRVSPCALIARDVAEALSLSDRVTRVSHNHPEGMKGARATTHAVFLALEGAGAVAIRQEIARVYGYDLSRRVDQIRPDYEFDETCQKTVPEALTCALEATSFEDAIRNAVSIGGDSDTVACIAGALAEGLFGIPEPILDDGRSRLPAGFTEILDKLYARRRHGAI